MAIMPSDTRECIIHSRGTWRVYMATVLGIIGAVQSLASAFDKFRNR